METILLTIGIITLVFSAVAVVTSVILLVKGKRGSGNIDVDKLKNELLEANRRDLQETRASIKEYNESQSKEIANQFGIVSSMIGNHFESQTKTLNDSIARTLTVAQKSIEDNKSTIDKLFDRTSKFQDGFTENTARSIDELNKTMKESLEGLRRDTGVQLDKMRDTVDEKLHKSLEERLTQSFSVITDKLERVRDGLNEMQNLSKGVTDLNKVLGGIKTRGNWGEVALRALLQDLLTEGQYEENVEIKKGKRVEFCILIPSKDGTKVKLPVDCKFPYDSFNAIVQASENGDIELLNQARKNFERTIKEQAKAIHEYVEPPKTTDFAIMYLPVEGLYAEVARNVDLVEKIRRDYNVIISGPSTFAALLNSLQAGFQSLAIQKKSGDIQKALQEFKKQFKLFFTYLDKSETQLGKFAETLSEMKKKSQDIDTKLSRFGIIDSDDGPELIEEASADSAE